MNESEGDAQYVAVTGGLPGVEAIPRDGLAFR